MDDLSSQYLDAFTSIEIWLRNQDKSKERKDFPQLVDFISESNYSVHRNSYALKQLNKFRNFVVHNYSKTKGMAVPTTHAVEQIIAIQIELLKPPSLISVAASPVEKCRPTDPLGCSVKKMHDGVFSQLPICDEQKFLGLLTAETIARWLATEFVGDWKGIVDEKPVAEVMQYQEDHDNHRFLAKSATVADGLAAFDDFLHRGKRLEAILITHNGHSSEALLGIVTVHDIPKLNQEIHG